MKVLQIGQGSELVKQFYPDAEIDVVAMKPKKNTRYDAVVAFMVLQKVFIKDITNTLKMWVDALNVGGTIVILVPSLEWAAFQILTPEPNPALYRHLYGTKDNPVNSMYTMMMLRHYLASAGIAVTHAKTGEYTLGEYTADCHIIEGTKK